MTRTRTPPAEHRPEPLSGWVHAIIDDRTHLVLRNRGQLVRVRLVRGSAAAHIPRGIGLEQPVEVTPSGLVDGDGTVVVDRLEPLSPTPRMPFTPATRKQTPAATRAHFRYLEFRDPDVLELLKARHRMITAMSGCLDHHGFIAVETPLLAAPSGSGAREFGVYSSRHDQQEYALPQSPQVYGQLTVAGGVDRYYQLARCFRDEDLRADRQPEFTQLQIEIAFASRDAVLAMAEETVCAGMAAVHRSMDRPIERLCYADCLRRYGTDKPDLRFAAEITLLPVRLTDEHAGFGGDVITTRLPPGLAPARKWWATLHELARIRGLHLLGFWSEDHPSRPLPLEVESGWLVDTLPLVPDWRPGLTLVWRGAWLQVHRLARLLYRELRKLPPPDEIKPAWVLDFPLFELEAKTGHLVAANHPFVAPADPVAFARARRRAELLELDSTSFDLVINGEEVASGSILNHDPNTQARILQLLATSRRERTGPMRVVLESLKYGAPPIGGLGIGVDRLLAIAQGSVGVREVIAYPKSKNGQCPVLSRS